MVYCKFTYWTNDHFKQSRLKGLSIIVNVLGLLLGIILLFNPMMGMILVSTMIAITFAILGVTYVIDGLA